MIADVSTIVASIQLRNVPVLFIDTCAILDILRVPMRQNINFSHLEGAKEIVDKQKQSKISTVITTTIETEYNEHLHNTEIELARHISDLASNNERLINSIESIGLSYEFNVKNIYKTELPTKLKEMAEEIIANSYIIEKDDECIKKAFARVETYAAPSRRGKSESKDCVIIEHFLKIASELRQLGFQKKFVFITSNSSDYGKVSKLNPPLDTEFQNLLIAYCNTFKWAISQIS